MPNTSIKLATAIAGQYGTPSHQRPSMSAAPPTLGPRDLRYLRPLATARSQRFACIPWTNSPDCGRATGWRSSPRAAPAPPVRRWCASPSLTPGHTVVKRMIAAHIQIAHVQFFERLGWSGLPQRRGLPGDNPSADGYRADRLLNAACG
jgi:hypothetical protein